jgi:hypothetical protein
MFRGRARRTDFRIRLRSVTVPTLDELAHRHSGLGAEAVAWLQRLVADWQIIADLSFADLVLWLPDRDGAGYWAGAQMRPTTGPTAYVDDVVGTYLPLGKRVLLDSALRDGRVAREGDPEWRDDVPVRVRRSRSGTTGRSSPWSPATPTCRACARPAGWSCRTSRPPASSRR